MLVCNPVCIPVVFPGCQSAGDAHVYMHTPFLGSMHCNLNTVPQAAYPHVHLQYCLFLFLPFLAASLSLPSCSGRTLCTQRDTRRQILLSCISEEIIASVLGGIIRLVLAEAIHQAAE